MDSTQASPSRPTRRSTLGLSIIRAITFKLKLPFQLCPCPCGSIQCGPDGHSDSSRCANLHVTLTHLARRLAASRCAWQPHRAGQECPRCVTLRPCNSAPTSLVPSVSASECIHVTKSRPRCGGAWSARLRLACLVQRGGVAATVCSIEQRPPTVPASQPSAIDSSSTRGERQWKRAQKCAANCHWSGPLCSGSERGGAKGRGDWARR